MTYNPGDKVKIESKYGKSSVGVVVTEIMNSSPLAYLVDIDGKNYRILARDLV